MATAAFPSTSRLNRYNANMLANLSLSGLALLRYLHEHSGGTGERIALEPRRIWRSLRISETQFTQDSVSLAELGLAGIRNFRPNANDVPSQRVSSIWLTTKGEEYLKQAKVG